MSDVTANLLSNQEAGGCPEDCDDLEPFGEHAPLSPPPGRGSRGSSSSSGGSKSMRKLAAQGDTAVVADPFSFLRRRRFLHNSAVSAVVLTLVIVVAQWLGDASSGVSRTASPIAAPRSALAVHGKEICFDGRYAGEAGMGSFFVGFGTHWAYFSSFGGMLAVKPDARDKAHHKSVLRSLPFNVTAQTSFSLSTRGGRSDPALVNDKLPDLTGTSSRSGFLGIAVRNARTGKWGPVKSRHKGGEEEETITFTPDDLHMLVGEQVTVDVVDTLAGIWGWIAVDRFHLAGTCPEDSPFAPGGMPGGVGVGPGDVAAGGGLSGEEASWAAQHLGQNCAYLDSAEEMATFFNALGTVWEWQYEYGGAMFNTASNAREIRHQKSILRSIPFTLSHATSLSTTTVGGRGFLSSVARSLANYSGMTDQHGFIGIALRSVETDHWLLSKRRQRPQADIQEVLAFEREELMPYVGKRVTLDVIDSFSGHDGWIGLVNFRLHGPCIHVQFKPKPTMPATTTTPKAIASPGTCAIGRILARPSLFCFSVMSPHEMKLIKQQFARRASIFACNDYTIISKLAISIGKDPCGSPVYTWHNDVSESTLGDTKAGAATSSFLNTKTFLLAWDSILLSDKWQAHDFVVKADPDCVFFPERLRAHANPYLGQNVFFLNCHKLGGRLYGALEVFSTGAVDRYHRNTHMCKDMKWQAWGEDLYIESCMRGLGVKPAKDFRMVGDDRCMAAKCTDTSHVAFHPYKDSGSYWHCWTQSGGKEALG